MVAPSRVEAAALLLSVAPPPWHVRHSRAVAEVAAFLAAAVALHHRDPLHDAAPGHVRDDRRFVHLVATAGLLHDVDKALPPDDPVRRFPHGEGSAAWLTRRGYGDLAPLVAAHPVTRLADERWFREVLLPSPIEVRIVAYADKRAGQRLESMAERFASWERRYPPSGGMSGGMAGGGTHTGSNAGTSGRRAWDSATLAAVRERARELEASVCGEAGLEPGDVRRLRWAGRAIEAALRGDPDGGQRAPAPPAPVEHRATPPRPSPGRAIL